LVDILSSNENINLEVALRADGFLKKLLLKGIEILKCAHYKVAAEVIDFFHHSLPYLSRDASKRMGEEFCTNCFVELCKGCISQIPYPQGFNHDEHDEEELLFIEFRTSVDNLLKYILQHADALFINFIAYSSSQVLSAFTTTSFNSIEAILHVLFLVMTSQKANVMSKDPSGAVLRGCFESFVKNGIGKIPDLSVSMTYLDLIPKFSQSFENADLLLIAFTDLCGPHGLSSQFKILRTRSAFVLLRLVKEYASEKKQMLAPFVEGVSGLILNIISSCLEHWRVNGFSTHSLESCNYNEDEVYYLSECLGILISTSVLGIEHSHAALGSVISLLLEKANEIASNRVSLYLNDNSQKGILVCQFTARLSCGRTACCKCSVA
jgi:hypothetical protein